MKTNKIADIITKNLADRSFPIYLTNYENQGFAEADVFGISRAGQMYEFEIKVSKSDFFADLKNKKYKHKNLSEKKAIQICYIWKKGKRTEETFERIIMPNRFYYVCPFGLIDKSEIPDYAGLIYCDSDKPMEIKPAPLLHHYKANEIIYKNIATILSQRNKWGCAYRSYKYKLQNNN